jgi:hypothetical protein
MRVANRLLLCRVSLVLICFLPTVVVGGWILAGTVSGFWLADKGEWERVLTERLGLVAQIDDVRYTRHGNAELVGVRLLEGESRALVVEARRIEVAGKADDWQVSVEGAVILGDRLDCLARVVAPRILECRREPSTVWIGPDNVLVRGKEQEHTLERMQAELRFSTDKTGLDVSWHLPGAESNADLIRLVATRDRSRHRCSQGIDWIPGTRQFRVGW